MNDRFYERIFNQTQSIGNVGTWMMDKETGELWWSDKQYEIFSIDRNRKPCTDVFLGLMHPEDRIAAKAWFDGLLESNINGERSRFCHRILVGNRVKWIDEKTVQYTCPDDGRCFLIGNSYDFTRQKRQKEHYLELEQRISMAKLKSEFFTTMSHEFKTPINIILSSLQVLNLKLDGLDRKTRAQFDPLCGYVERNSYKLLRLATNLIDFSKIENRFLEPANEHCDVVAVLRELAHSARPYAEVNGLSLTFVSRVKAGQGWALCDSDIVERVLLNLLSNSIKNTPEGGRITVTVSSTENFFRVSVKDTGIGVPAALLPYVFNLLRKDDMGLTRSSGGSGMGLSIAKGLVEMQGGEMDAKSVEGEGSTFRFTISRHLKPRNVPVEEDDGDGRKIVHFTRLRMEMSDVLR